MSDRSFQLVVRKGPNSGEIFTLSSSSISIGRDPMSDITISDPEVSRYHAQLAKTETGYQILDMESTNGTYIDGVRLGSDPVPLVPGKAIQLGSGIILDYKITGMDEAALATVIDTSREPLAAAPEATDESPPVEEAEEMPPLPEPESPPVASVTTPPPVTEPPPPPPPPPPPVITDEGGGKRSRSSIIAVIAILIVCCCCAFLVSGYFWWGDLLLNWLAAQLGINIPAILN